MLYSSHSDKGRVLYENVIMPNINLPIHFIKNDYEGTGPFCIMHWHEEVELVYVESGFIASTCNGNALVAGPGDFIFVNSNEFHDYSILESPASLYCILIDLSLLKGPYLNFYETKQYTSTQEEIIVLKNHIENDEGMKNLFKDLWNENESKNMGYEYAVKSHLYGIFSLLVRNHINSIITCKENSHKNQNIQKINRVIEYIEENYHKDISLDHLAELLNFNRYYFCRFFKEITGVTPIEYINNYRIHQAMLTMDRYPHMSITEVALNCGYNDPNYFTRTFRKITGSTPSEYKNTKAHK